jgi:hypothetical protein
MRVLVNGVRLFFDVEGTKLVPNAPAMRERPTLLLLRPRRRRTRILCNSNGLPNCRHAVVPDAPERAMAEIRDFIGRK